MASKASTGRVGLLYKFIELHKHHYPAQVMCEVLKVAPGGYCEWLHRPLSDRAMEDARLLRLIRKSFVAGHGIYGAPRVFRDLREAGETCSKHRVGRLMRQNDRRAAHGYRTRRVSAGQRPAPLPNLLERKFTVNRSNKAWVADNTYNRTRQGWLYRAVVMDLFSRTIVGWATSATLHRELMLDAVLRAVRKRKRRDAIIPSDQGTRYGSDGWKRLCKSNSLIPGMSRRDNCWERQRRRRVLLQQPEEGADQEAYLQERRACERRHRGLHRYLLQSNAKAWPSGRRQPRRLRGSVETAQIWSPPNPGNSRQAVWSQLTEAPQAGAQS